MFGLNFEHRNKGASSDRHLWTRHTIWIEVAPCRLGISGHILTDGCVVVSLFSWWSSYFYVPNLCILGTRPVLPCENGSCCKLELIGTKSVFVLRYSCYLSVLVAHRWNCHTSKFNNYCAYRSVFYGYLATASVSFGLPAQFVHWISTYKCGCQQLAHFD